MYGFDNQPMTLGMSRPMFQPQGGMMTPGAQAPAWFGTPNPAGLGNPMALVNLAQRFAGGNDEANRMRFQQYQDMISRLTQMNQAQMAKTRGLLG